MLDFDFEIRYKKGSEMPADFLSRSFTEIGAISAMDMKWEHEQAKDNLSNLVKESINKEWIYKFPMPEWYKKAEHIANMAVIKNNIIWIKKNDKLLLYVTFKLRRSTRRPPDRPQRCSKMQKTTARMLLLAEHG